MVLLLDVLLLVVVVVVVMEVRRHRSRGVHLTRRPDGCFHHSGSSSGASSRPGVEGRRRRGPAHRVVDGLSDEFSVEGVGEDVGEGGGGGGLAVRVAAAVRLLVLLLLGVVVVVLRRVVVLVVLVLLAELFVPDESAPATVRSSVPKTAGGGGAPCGRGRRAGRRRRRAPVPIVLETETVAGGQHVAERS